MNKSTPILNTINFFTNQMAELHWYKGYPELENNIEIVIGE